MKNILEYIENSEKKFSDKIAVIEEKKCTYGELVAKSKRIATVIKNEIGIRKPVPILMDKGINALSTFFGTVYAGDFYILLNPDLPVTRLIDIFNTLGSNILVTDNEHNELAKQICSSKILLVEDMDKVQTDEEALFSIRNQSMDTDPLYVNFTSGSTGKPKGVVIDHKSVIDFISVFTEKFGISDKDIIANQAPFDFDVSVKDIYSSMKVGATLVIVPKKIFSRPADLLDYICYNNVTTLIWAVSALCLITTFHGLDYKVPNSVNKVLFSGEVMPLKHLKQWIAHLPNAMFVNLYGPTEITCNCTYYIIDNNKEYDDKIPIGIPFDNKEIILLSEDNNEVKENGDIGEICVRGNSLALGYYGNMELSNKCFIQNPLNNKYRDIIYKTGDLGYYNKDGNLVFSGRKDFQIKHQGHRIELEEIQIALEKIDEIKRACVLYNEEKSKIYGYYIGNIDKKEIHAKLTDILPVFMIPNVLIPVKEFPLTKNGKIDRKVLAEIK
ncbi:MAG: amino acid adenylation domain-containing protein [Clostridia bacterium]|nr:amino acid adenylation domain-containing protein [Clostridia bacterium]